MTAILALLARAVAILLEVLSGVQAIRGIVEALKGGASPAAVESAPYNIETQTLANAALLTNGTYGLAAINTSVNLVPGIIQGTGLPTIADVLAAITSVNPVTLPSTPPEGYGGTTFGPVISWQMCSLD
jgi:hypothetical protein